MLIILAAALLSSTSSVSAKDVMAPYELVCTNKIRFEGPAPIESTKGNIGLYTFQADLTKTIERIRQKVRAQDGYDEFAGFSGMRWPMNSADHSFHWSNGKDSPSIGIYRDFKARSQVIKDIYAATFPEKLVGASLKGWITVIAFDGRTISH